MLTTCEAPRLAPLRKERRLCLFLRSGIIIFYNAVWVGPKPVYQDLGLQTFAMLRSESSLSMGQIVNASRCPPRPSLV